MWLKGKAVRARLPLWLVCCGYLLLATAYSLVNPIYEAPDETYHYAYVRYLLDERALPPLTGTPGQTFVHQEETQPPLYYALGALLVAGVPVEPGPFYEFNPHAWIGAATREGNVNVLVHGHSDEDFPYRGHALAVHLLRLYSVLLGLGTVLGVYAVARRVTTSEGVAIVAAALVAFLPQFLFISGAVNNDNAVTFLGTLGLWLALSFWRRPTLASALVLGLVMGLAALAKLGGLTLAPLVALIGALAAWRARSLRPAAHAAVAGAVMALVAGWWYARNLLLTGDPFAFNRHFAYMGLRPSGFGPLDLLPELEGLRLSFWGLFGWHNVWADDRAYLLLDGMTLLFIAGGVRWLARRQPLRVDWGALGLVCVYLGLVLVAFLRWTLITWGTQGRLLFPALAALAVFAALGLASWVGEHGLVRAGAAVAAALFVLSGWVLGHDIAPAYQRPAPVTEAELIAGASPAYAEYGERIALVGYRLGRQRLAPGEKTELILYWKALAAVEQNYSVFVHVADDPTLRVAQSDTYPCRGNYPTRYWRPGEIVADSHILTIWPDTAPGTYRVFVGLYDKQTGQRLPCESNDEDNITVLQTLAVVPADGL